MKKRIPERMNIKRGQGKKEFKKKEDMENMKNKIAEQ